MPYGVKKVKIGFCLRKAAFGSFLLTTDTLSLLFLSYNKVICQIFGDGG